MSSDRVMVSRRRNHLGVRETSASFTEQATDEDCLEVAALPNVITLSLGPSPFITDTGFGALCRLATLDSMYVQNLPSVSESGAEQVAGLTGLTNFDTYDWARQSLIPALCTLPSLGSCGMIRADLTDEEVEPLAVCSSLESLDFQDNQVEGMGLGPFSDCSTLRRLSVCNNPISNRGIRTIAAIAPLEELALGGTVLDGLSLEPLAHMPRLYVLHVNNSDITASQLGELQGGTSPRRLWISHESLGPDAIDALATLMQLKGLMICGEAPPNLARTIRTVFRQKGVHCAVQP
ncbi:MAG TPA: hypothetical protein VG055_29230 [Planctomycetaceae bacterium]|jgi:hypothetical protein|nr:hypothetical protein [Planctomycetaceae bacterium]